MNATQYFAQPDTPSAGSKVGVLMLRIIAKNPGKSFEDARAEANDLLERAAGKRVYSLPRVLSPEERELERNRLKIAFRSLPKAA